MHVCRGLDQGPGLWAIQWGMLAVNRPNGLFFEKKDI
jgi:hypothetical protein